MNAIQGLLDKSDCEDYYDYLNYRVDGYWLDEKLEELYPGNGYQGLIPTLLFCLESEEEQKVVWSRILPKAGAKTVCPIFMCPDDCDFSCSIVNAEIEHTGTTVRWNRVGLDMTQANEHDLIGSTVQWLDKVEPLEFELGYYHRMLNAFKKHFEIDKEKWEESNRKFQEKSNSKILKSRTKTFWNLLKRSSWS